MRVSQHRTLVSWLVLLSNLAKTSAQNFTTYDVNQPSDVRATICGDIVNANLYEGQEWFYASDVIDCLTSIPFLPDVGSRFIRWYNDTLQFQASSAYLRNPPASYQQPAFDIFAGLQSIQDKIDAGYYKNEYAFEADVQRVSQQAHDSHLEVFGGATYAFTFSAPFYIATVSTDGKQSPKTYVWDDLYECAAGPGSCSYSAISSINGVPTEQYLSDYASRQSFGFVEPDADWQNLVYTPAQGIVLGFNAFSGDATFFPGTDLNITFENGTTAETEWISLYNSPGFTGPLATAGDFYNFFVLGLLPANFNETYADYLGLFNSTDDSDNSTDTGPDPTQNLTSWTSVIDAYPDTITHQEYLGLYSPGFITGYYLDDVRTAVLSIPSFQEYGDGIGTFSEAVVDFINNATARNASKVIIDLQQNMGGQSSLAFDVFRQFFPRTLPFAGSRRRSFYEADLIGQATTNYFDSITNTSSDAYQTAVSSEWVATELINAQTNANFTSWQQLYGPLRYKNDTFSLPQRYNLTSELFDNAFLDIDFPDCFYTQTCDDTGLWTGKDIIVLTDGLCTSTCTLFVEMMTRDGGAHSVVVGGRPESGPMQTASGSRGAAAYSRSFIDTDIAYISQYNATINNTLGLRGSDDGANIIWAGFTLRDQIRNDSTTPNQFLYLPAECRIYWSLANFNNYTRLWHDTYNGIFGDISVCVAGSRNVTQPPAKLNPRAITALTDDQILAKFIINDLKPNQSSTDTDIGIGQVEDANGQAGANGDLVFCDDGKGNPVPSLCGGQSCQKAKFPCKNPGTCAVGAKSCPQVNAQVQRFVCEKPCKVALKNGQCGGAFTCNPTVAANSAKRTVTGGNKARVPTTKLNAANGFCSPPQGDGTDTCSDLDDEGLQELVKSRE